MAPFDHHTPLLKSRQSVTLYDREGFQVGNSLNRFAVSSWMPSKPKSEALTGRWDPPPVTRVEGPPPLLAQ